MFKILMPVMILLLSSMAHGATRDEMLNKLYQLQGYPEAYAYQNELVRAETARSLEQALPMLETVYVLKADDKKKIEEINQRYVTTMGNVDTAENNQAFWRENYGPNFTDAELAELIRVAETPLDRKARAIDLDVNKKGTQRFLELNRTAKQAATQEYSTALGAILAQCACKIDNAPAGKRIKAKK